MLRALSVARRIASRTRSRNPFAETSRERNRRSSTPRRHLHFRYYPDNVRLDCDPAARGFAYSSNFRRENSSRVESRRSIGSIATQDRPA